MIETANTMYGSLNLALPLIYLTVVVLLCLFVTYILSLRKNKGLASSLVELEHDHGVLKREMEAAKKEIAETRKKLEKESANHRKVEEDLRYAINEAENATKIKSEFLATMSHEIRTPMNGVLGMTELLMKTDLSNKQTRFAEAIHQSGEALLTIINDVLDFSKIEAGKLELKKEPFDLRQLIEDTTAMFAKRAEQQKVELACMYPVERHTAFNGDSNRIRQILTNLIGNAVKFTEHGEIVVNVKFGEDKNQRTQIYFEVVDTGIGIKKELVNQVFDSFTQVDGSMTRRFGGTGLGLAICKKLVDLMDGEIGLYSEYGKGSTFWFRLVLEKDSPANLRTNSDMTGASIKGSRILLLDDSETSRNIMQQQIEGWHAIFDSAVNEKQAMHKLYSAAEQGKPFDIAIFEKQLPDLNVFSLTDRIRKDEKLNKTKVIILSSMSQMEETGEWMMAGVEAYLNKPLRQSDLFNCLERIYNKDKISDMEKSADSISKKENAEERLGGYVLVAEDNPINQELITHMLESFGIRFNFVYNGKEAVEAITDSPLDLQTDPYDMILMDCQMPEMDGFEATGIIREWEKIQQRAPLPIVALTANAMQGDREKCLGAGMDDYLSKPFTSKQLFTVLEKWLPISNVIKDDGRETSIANSVSESTHVSTLDQDAIARIRQLQRKDSADVLLKIIDIYLQKGPELMQEISQAISTGDADKLRHAAHSLKSSSASLGASAMAELCKELELMGREKSLENAMMKLDFLEFEFEGVCRALQYESEQQAA